MNKIEDKPRKRVRRLKPEVAAQFAAYRKTEQTEQVKQLYQRPVEELSPEEIAQMRAAFFKS